MLEDEEFKNCMEELYHKYKTKEVNLILTSNYSPCKGCADDLIKFYGDEKSPVKKLVIRFSHPYETKKDKHHLDGLKDLDKAGITLEAMTEKSWREVIMTDKSWFDALKKDAKSSFKEMMNEKNWFDKVMELFGLDPVKVRDRDDATRAKLEELLTEDFENLNVSSAIDSEGLSD